MDLIWRTPHSVTFPPFPKEKICHNKMAPRNATQWNQQRGSHGFFMIRCSRLSSLVRLWSSAAICCCDQKYHLHHYAITLKVLGETLLCFSLWEIPLSLFENVWDTCAWHMDIRRSFAYLRVSHRIQPPSLVKSRFEILLHNIVLSEYRDMECTFW